MLSTVFGSAATAALFIGGLTAPLPSIIAVSVILLAFFLLVFMLAFTEKGRAFVKWKNFEFRIDPFHKKDKS